MGGNERKDSRRGMKREELGKVGPSQGLGWIDGHWPFTLRMLLRLVVQQKLSQTGLKRHATMSDIACMSGQCHAA